CPNTPTKPTGSATSSKSTRSTPTSSRGNAPCSAGSNTKPPPSGSPKTGGSPSTWATTNDSTTSTSSSATRSTVQDPAATMTPCSTQEPCTWPGSPETALPTRSTARDACPTTAHSTAPASGSRCAMHNAATSTGSPSQKSSSTLGSPLTRSAPPRWTGQKTSKPALPPARCTAPSPTTLPAAPTKSTKPTRAPPTNTATSWKSPNTATTPGPPPSPGPWYSSAATPKTRTPTTPDT